MNYVTVEGGNKKQRAEVEEIVNWVIAELMPRYRTLDITINLCDTLKDGAFGWCMPETNREFTIDVHKKEKEFVKGKEDFIKTIMHEMTHVWQYATGTLKQSNACQMMWKKKDYTDTPYSKQPWERQAHRMEDTLYEKWLREYK